MSQEMNNISRLAAQASADAHRANERFEGQEFQAKISNAVSNYNLSSSAGTTTQRRAATPPPAFNWSIIPSEDKRAIIQAILDGIDNVGLTEAVSERLRLDTLREDVADHDSRLGAVEREFRLEQGAIPRLQTAVDDLVARRNVSACERAGYIFNGPEDCEAQIRSVGADAKVCTKCLDLYSLLTLSQDPYVTYESGIKVHADANKANFDGVAESRVKLSFSVPFPEVVVKVVDSASTASHGGAKWASSFASADVFEDNFREGAHRRVVKAIDRTYELLNKSVDHTFPVSQRGSETPSMRKIHTILSEQNRMTHRQTIAFIECLMPFYRTLMGGSLTKEEAWDRVFVFVLEFLTTVQEQRVLAATDVTSEAQMMWAALKATDFIEEFRKAKFIEHPKALAILALTSIEREGKAQELLEERLKKLVEAGVSAKYSRLETRVQTAENKLKSIVMKNPDLK